MVRPCPTETRPFQLELVSSHPQFAEIFLRWREDEVTRRFNPLDPLDLEQCRARLAKEGGELREIDRADAFRWFVRLDGQLVANVSVRDINRKMLTAEIAYDVAAEHRGKGIGSAAVGLVIARLFAQTELRRLIAFVHEGNIVSRRLLERIGFTCEGLLREHYLVEGQPVNEALYGLLAREWRG